MMNGDSNFCKRGKRKQLKLGGSSFVVAQCDVWTSAIQTLKYTEVEKQAGLKSVLYKILVLFPILEHHSGYSTR